MNAVWFLPALALPALGPACSPPRPDLASGRNLLLVTVDTTRADYVSCLGGDPRNTPNIDALAARSTLFTNAVSEANVTNPSHASILSGLRAIQHGVFSNVVALPAGIDTLPEAFKRLGYQTAGFVAAFLLSDIPKWRGFDTLPSAEGVLTAAAVTDRAIDWLDRRDPTRPFFLWVHYYDAHATYEPAPEDAARFYQRDPTAGDEPPIALEPWFESAEKGTLEWLLHQHGPIRDRGWPRAMYQAEIHAMDREIGRLLARVAQLGQEPDTVVVLSADHGESLGEHGIFYDHKGLFEQQLRIPLLIHVPGLQPRRSAAFASTIDIVPTLEQLLGFRMRAPTAGVSLLSELLGRPSRELDRRRSFVHQSAHNRSVALREGDWKLIWLIGEELAGLPDRPLLFDLRADPSELRDLYALEPERAQLMRRKLEPWIRLGDVERGEAPELSPEVRESLRALGYAEDAGG